MAASGVPAVGQGRSVTFHSPEVALEQGLGAHRSGFHKMAEPGLTFAAESGSLLGRYYLARLYADASGPLTDHAKAYKLYNGIYEEHATTIDVEDHPHARYVGKSLTALAVYMLRGLPVIGLKPNAVRAAELLQEAATFFRDPDAQFELAKLYLTGDGVEVNHRKATSWLSTLTEGGHPGAQAFLADLYWRGKVLPRDENRALALITLAVENAPEHERIWIEDTYQSIYCGMAAGVRSQSDGLIASFRQRFSPRPGTEPQEALGLGPRPVRACADGTPLPATRSDNRADDASKLARTPASTPGMPRALQGGMLGISGGGAPQR